MVLRRYCRVTTSVHLPGKDSWLQGAMAEDQLIETDRPHQEMSGQLGDPTKTLKQPQVTPSKSQHRMLAAEASSGETKATPLQALRALLWQGSTRKVQQMAFAKGGIVVPPIRGLLLCDLTLCVPSDRDQSMYLPSDASTRTTWLESRIVLSCPCQHLRSCHSPIL